MALNDVKTIVTRIQLKNDTAANWEKSGLVLKQGEFAYASDTGYIKIGDGSKTWAQLSGIRIDAGNVDNIVSTVSADMAAAVKATVDTNNVYALSSDDSLTYTLVTKELSNGTWSAWKAVTGESGVTAQFTLPNVASLSAAEVTGIIRKISETNGVISAEAGALSVADIPELPQSKVTGLTADLNALSVGKQDNLAFEGAYDASTNKVVTRTYLEDQIKDITSAMHFIGVVDKEGAPELSTGSTVSDYSQLFTTITGTAAAGDVVIQSDREFVWANGQWNELGSEGVYATKNELSAAISAVNSTISALSTDLNGQISALSDEIDGIDAAID